MSTRQQIREQVRSDLAEQDPANTHISDSDINEFINQGVKYLGVLIEYPRDTVQVAGDSSAEVYTVPDDFLFLRWGIFGDPTVQGDSFPLIVITDKTLMALFPGWLENITPNKGKPTYIVLIDKQSLFVFPRVDSTNNGKPITYSYCYQPAPLNVDSAEPDLPLPYHDALHFYASHLAYIRLQMPDKAAIFLQEFDKFRKSIETTVVKEADDSLRFQFQYVEDL